MSFTDVGYNQSGDWGMIPTEDFSVITYNQLLQSYSQMLGDKMFFISIYLFVYVLMNMFIFNEGARYRERFDKFNVGRWYIPQIKGGFASLIFVVAQQFAFSGALMLVMFNIIYRWNLKI